MNRPHNPDSGALGARRSMSASQPGFLEKAGAPASPSA